MFWYCERDDSGKVVSCERICIYFYEFAEVPAGPRAGIGGVMRAKHMA